MLAGFASFCDFTSKPLKSRVIGTKPAAEATERERVVSERAERASRRERESVVAARAERARKRAQESKREKKSSPENQIMTSRMSRLD